MKEKGIKKAGTPKDSRYYFGLINLENQSRLANLLSE